MSAVSRLPWLWARLRAMSAAEIGWRIQSQWHAAVEARNAGREQYIPLPSTSPDQIRRELGDSLSALVPQPAWRERFPQQFPDAHDQLRRRAEEARRGRVPVYARTYDLGTAVDWYRDPEMEISAPSCPAARMDYRDREECGNARRIWEINRHHHLVEVAQWGWLSRDPESLDFAVEQLLDWCDKNPPLWGINWTSSLELAIRTLSWAEILALAIDAESPALDDDALARLTGAWARQVEYVRRHDSRFSSANNHRIGEAAAVAVAGLAMPFHPKAESWWRWGKATLEEETLLQFHPDGVGAEQAFAYQRFVLDFMTVVRVLARARGEDFGAEAVERLGEATSFLDAVTREDGTVFAVGDDDEGRAFALGESEPERTLATLECMGWLHGEPRWRRARYPRAEWLGLAAEDAPAETEVQPSLCTDVFRSGGYVVVRGAIGEQPFWLLFDAGPLGFDTLAAHGHADSLQLLLWCGEDLLIDPGTGSYHGDPDWREALRGTDAHNTCALDDADQSKRRGLFLWGDRATSRMQAAGADAPWFVLAGSHDGYRDRSVPQVRRIVAGHQTESELFLLVVDELQGEGNHGVSVPWHLGPNRPDESDGLHFAVHTKSGLAVDGRAATLGIDPQGILDRRWGGKLDGSGWYSPRFEERESAATVAVRARGTLPGSVVWLLRVSAPGTAGTEPAGSATLESCDGGLQAIVDLGTQGTLRALVADPGSTRVTDGRSTLEGRLALWREGEPAPANGKTVVAGATAFHCGMMSWKGDGTPLTGVLRTEPPRAESL